MAWLNEIYYYIGLNKQGKIPLKTLPRHRTIAILALLIAVASVVYIVGSSKHNVYPLVGSLGVLASPTKHKANDETGKCFIGKGRTLIQDDSPEESNLYHSIALALATDDLIRKINDAKTFARSGDFDFSGTWKDFTLESTRLSEGGLARQRTVMLVLRKDEALYRCSIVNQRLEYPDAKHALDYETLKSTLESYGVDTSQGKRIGNSLWEQTLVYEP